MFMIFFPFFNIILILILNQVKYNSNINLSYNAFIKLYKKRLELFI
ncbi:hypothetical protein MFUM_530002 [Methylacidiphilum fumariolicum SolV]|uniref:Uncharacterized protein n=2 Tax=Candidatus Methylacidiphilum fumarolicum TaxID=591154 RepID=I0JYB9_METFB|nr:conserved protein of unknown function [Candidatus Methylacidiphilum fumarolicum]CCG92238.1 hypothetical protein MFUM_530002 [Methylacidiphilum fumariolicum SolV]